jgi:hypothetical protein
LVLECLNGENARVAHSSSGFLLDEWGARMLAVRFAWDSSFGGSPLTRREERVNGPPGDLEASGPSAYQNTG